MTVSDSDRDRVINALREQAGEGRLDLDEFGQRLDEAYQATTVDELRHALRELPVALALGQQAEPERERESVSRESGPRSRQSRPWPTAPVPPTLPRSPRSPASCAPRPFNSPERVAGRHVAAKAAWGAHLGAYLAVNLMLVVIWLMTSGPGGYFWPMWPMMGWGIGLASHGMAHAAGSKARRRKLEP